MYLEAKSSYNQTIHVVRNHLQAPQVGKVIAGLQVQVWSGYNFPGPPYRGWNRQDGVSVDGCFIIVLTAISI